MTSLLGSLLTYEGDFGLTLGSVWGQFWCMRVTLNHFGITLEELFAPDGDLVETLGSSCGQDWHLRAALGALWRRVWVTLVALAAYGGDFGATLGSFWGQFGVSLGISG